MLCTRDMNFFYIKPPCYAPKKEVIVVSQAVSKGVHVYSAEEVDSRINIFFYLQLILTSFMIVQRHYNYPKYRRSVQRHSAKLKDVSKKQVCSWKIQLLLVIKQLIYKVKLCTVGLFIHPSLYRSSDFLLQKKKNSTIEYLLYGFD